MLHIVNKSPRASRTLPSCMRIARPGEALLLIEDAVYAATPGGALACGMAEAVQRFKVYVLRPDLEARGMAGRLVTGVTPVDYQGFVDLVAEHPINQTWL
jgi:tRNA 2-thiouridine synthesizing protein B